MENPYRGFAPVCIDGLSIASRSRGCKRGQGNFLHFGRFDKFFRQNWAKWRKIGGIFLCLFLFCLRRVFSYFCLRRVTFFPCRKKVTKERHLRKGGFRFPPFLKNLFPLKRPKREGVRVLPLWKHPPGDQSLRRFAPPPFTQGRLWSSAPADAGNGLPRQ